MADGMYHDIFASNHLPRCLCRYNNPDTYQPTTAPYVPNLIHVVMYLGR